MEVELEMWMRGRNFQRGREEGGKGLKYMLMEEDERRGREDLLPKTHFRGC